MDGGAWWAAVHGVAESRTRLSDFTFTFPFPVLEKVWATFAVTILLWATESLTGISSNIVALIPLAVFVCTGTFDKEDIKQIDWSVLWLVAGGFALGYDQPA